MNLITPFKNASLLPKPDGRSFDMLVNQFMDDSLLVDTYGETIALGVGIMTICSEMISFRLCYVEGDLYFRNVRCKKTNPWIKESKSYAGLLIWFRNTCLFEGMTTKDVKTIVEFCLECGYIPQKSMQEFKAMLKPWKIDSQDSPR